MAPVLAKSLSRLSRESIVNLCLKWTQSDTSVPYLASNRNLLESEEEDYLHEPAESVANLKELYLDLKRTVGGRDALSKQDIIDRIVDGDWRRGLSLQQLADVDFAALEQNDTSLRWSALKLVPLVSSQSNESASSHPGKRRKISQLPVDQPHYPSVSPSTFITNLKSHIGPLVKAHYTIHRLSSPSKLVVLRLYIVPNTPFAPRSSNVPHNARQATDSGRIMYIALPDSCPYVYISLSGSSGSSLAAKSKDGKAAAQAKIDIAGTKRIILESIPKALSKPQERWSLENTKLTCRSLKAIGLLRGNGRPGTAGGCLSKFSEEDVVVGAKARERSGLQSKTSSSESIRELNSNRVTPLSIIPLQNPVRTSPDSRTAQVDSRFGNVYSNCKSHAKLDRFHVTITNILAEPSTSKPTAPSSTTSQPKKKRKRRSLEDIEAGRDVEEYDSVSSEPTAAAATTTQPKGEPAPITISFSGVDVFRGLRELALVDGGKHVDLERMPAWMTGEKGLSALVV